MNFNHEHRDRLNDAAAHLDLAYAFEESREFERALRECDKAIAIAPSVAEAHNLRGIILEDLNRREDAVRAYKEAIRLDPEFTEAADNLSDLESELEDIERLLDQANAFEENGDLEMALRKCDEVIAIDPSLAQAHNLRGIVLEQLGRRREALKAYQEAVRLKPDFEEAGRNLSELESEVVQTAVRASDRPSGQVSAGSKLGAMAGLIITAAFFLPWVRACNVELSGYDLATNQTRLVEGPEMYWLVLVAGLICIGLFLFVRTGTAKQLRRVASARLLVGVVGFFPVLNVWANVREKGGAMKILVGGWLTALGFLGILVSFLLDLGGSDE